MTNNLAERTVKPFVIDRKNFLFSATDKGADASALFMSVIETAKRNGLNVFGYLSYLMLVLPSWAKHLRKNSLTASCRGVLLCLKPATEHIIRSLKTWLRLSDSFSSTVFHRTVIHSNSLQFIVMNRIRDLSRGWSRLILFLGGAGFGWRLLFTWIHLTVK